MPRTAKQWDGREWQHWIDQLLYLRYGQAGYQRVPDRFQGDLGIEGFSRDGCAFQCYVAEESNVAKLYEKQRDKVTEDLNKFVDNAKDLERLLSPTRIKAWILVVPSFDSKQLLIHCAGKAETIRTLGLPHTADDFVVHVCTDDVWALEANKLKREGIGEVDLGLDLPDDRAVQDWMAANNAKAGVLDKKAAKLTSPEKHQQFVLATLRQYIHGQNAYERLRSECPTIFNDLLRLKQTLELRLERDCAVQTASARVTYQDIERLVSSRLSERCCALSPELRDSLAAEALADWLLRCPLDFEEGKG